MAEENQSPEEKELTPAQQLVSKARVNVVEALEVMQRNFPDALAKSPDSTEYIAVTSLQSKKEYFTKIVDSPQESKAYCEARRQELSLKKTTVKLTDAEKKESRQLEEIFKN